jgi:hypothetical protein
MIPLEPVARSGRFSPPAPPGPGRYCGAMSRQVVLVLVSLVVAGCGGGGSDDLANRGRKPIDFPPITYDASDDQGAAAAAPDTGGPELAAQLPPDAAPPAPDVSPALPPDAAPAAPDVMPAIPYPRCDRSVTEAGRACRGSDGGRLRTTAGPFCDSSCNGIGPFPCWAPAAQLGIPDCQADTPFVCVAACTAAICQAGAQLDSCK